MPTSTHIGGHLLDLIIRKEIDQAPELSATLRHDPRVRSDPTTARAAPIIGAGQECGRRSIIEGKPEVPKEVGTMKRKTISSETIKQSVSRSTRASAKLEGRTVPADFVRSQKVERFLEERRRRSA